MIAKLEGTVWKADPKFLVVGIGLPATAGGIGLKVFVTNETRAAAREGGAISLFTHLAVREDALDLYGFRSEEELSFFELLIGISGIGPKTALGILSASSVAALSRAAAENDTSHLVKVSGIGKKIAEKIVLELKDKVSAEDGGASLREEVDAIEALKTLGYSHKDARDALKEVEDKTTSTSDRVKEALKILGKK